MKNMKFWRTALVETLVLTVMLSVTGGTIAWFTDSVSSKVNTITAGNLDVELYYQLNGQTGWERVGATTNVFKADTLWEPGHTEVVKLKIVNEGSLALKYKLGVNIDSETGSVNVAGQNFLLSDFIKFGIVDGAQEYSREQAVAAVDATATTLKTANNSDFKELLPKTDDSTEKDAYTDIVTMVVYMPTTVDNEANHAADAEQPIINLGLNLIATQFTYEPDSFDNKSDKIGAISGGRIGYVDASSRWQIAADFAATGVETLAVNVVDTNGNIITTVTPRDFQNS